MFIQCFASHWKPSASVFKNLEAVSHKDTLYCNWVTNKSRKYVPEVLMVVLFSYSASLVIGSPSQVFEVTGE